MTSYPGYSRQRSQRPIRKDRVLIVVLFVTAIILLPILIRTGGPASDEPLEIVSDEIAAAGPPATSTTPTETVPTAPSSTTSQPPSATSTDASTLRHAVADGETISGVARGLGVTVENILASNRLFGSEQLQPGRVLYASTDGVLHQIKAGQTLTDISLSYAVPINTIAEANGIRTGETIYAGQRLLIPGVKNTFWDNVVALSKGTPSRFIWPVLGQVVSEFGWREHPVLGFRHHHDGIDIDVPEGTMIYASAGGKVYFYGEEPGYGNLLILQHADGYVSMYGHLASAFVYKGQYVEAGQAVARSGNTGISSGPHLHFEIRNGEFPVDPGRYLP